MPERIDRKTFIQLASLGTVGFFAHSSGNVSSSSYSELLKSARSPQQMTTVDDIACLGNGQLAVYESGADIMQVFGPPYSTSSAMDFRLDTSDIFIRVESQREANTAIWKHVLFSRGRKIGKLINFVVAKYPAFIRQIRMSEQINFYGTIPKQNSWLEDKFDISGFDISSAGLSRIPAGAYVYATYPIPKECCYQVITKGHSTLSKFSQASENKIALKCKPGKSTFYIIGGPSYPDCVDNTDQLLNSSWDQLLCDTRAYWQRFSSKRIDFANKISAQVPQRKNLLQAIDDISIIIKTQQSEQGAVLAGHNYHLGYIRDQYGVSRGLLKLGYIYEAKKILQFYFNIWQQKGTLHNALEIGIDASHMHKNDEVEITAYLILQAFDYYRESNDKIFLKEIFPMLEWAYYSQIKYLKKYMLPFNGDETYVAGGILPRATLLHGSAESTLLFIISADLLIQWAEKTSLWNSKVINKQKKLVKKTKAHYHKNFVRDGKLITNNPIRMEGANYPEFRHGVCEFLVPPCEVFGWTQKTVNNRYLCPTCYATKTQTFPPADPQIYFLLSVSLLPLYIHSNILSENEISALIKNIEKRYKKTGILPSRPDGNSTVGYDYGLLLYSLTKLGHPLANQVYKRMLSVVDQTGAWVEYYHDNEPIPVTGLGKVQLISKPLFIMQKISCLRIEFMQYQNRKIILIGLLIITCFFLKPQFLKGQQPDDSPRPGTWVATDDLGRQLPGHDKVGDKKRGKFVGLFYWTWQYQQEKEHEPKNITEILSHYPNAFYDLDHPAWGKIRSPHFWNEPLFGYYSRLDPWVLRKHAQMLADAGIDAVFFDCTNGSETWQKAYMELLKVWSKARKDGVQTPQVVFMLPFGPTDGSLRSIKKLYTNLYKPGKYKDLWFYWKGKPLIMAYPDRLRKTSQDSESGKLYKDIRNFFTFRPGQPLYDTGPERSDQWGWLQIYPQHRFAENGDGTFEQMTVGVSQNWSKKRGLTAMNAPDSFGRSYTHKNGHSSHPYSYLFGFNFQEQWERALKIDPELIFITGWNEWIAGRFKEWQGQKNAFPDQFDTEHSRDIEPMKGGFKDNYYYQMVANIRRFKGVARLPYVSKPQIIKIDGKYGDWATVRPEFRDYKGDTVHRDFHGWKGTYYRNVTGRNDIVRSKVARDDNALYFYVETAQPLSSDQDPQWMRLFINIDCNKKTGWEGYDYIINRQRPGNNAILEKSDGGWNWSKVGEVKFAVQKNALELKVPRSLVGMENQKIDIEFKWADNSQKEGNVMAFWKNGDVAPSGRFNYHYKEQ